MALTLNPLILAVVSIYLLFALRKRLDKSRRGLSLPPGPRPLPFIGNALSIPTENMAQAFREMTRKYGDVVYLEAFGKPMIILGTHRAALDLMEKRSAKYSDREPSTMAELSAWDWALPCMPYDAWWRRSRKAFHEYFNAGKIVQYQSVQLEATRRFLLRLVQNPDFFPEHIRYAIGSSIIRLAYGIDIDRESTPYLPIASAAMETFNAAFVPGKFLVETFPVLRFLPAWLPGAGFRSKASAWRVLVRRLRKTPWDAAIVKMNDGSEAVPSLAATMMESASDLEGQALREEATIAQDTLASAYAGGTDTLYTTTMTFFLAMAMNPEVQRRAQAELDAIVGPHRLPTFDDWPLLPYVTAIMRECMRWGLVLPLGFAHRSVEEDEYRGYYIPKGTLIIPNAWAYTRDGQYYPEPEEFRPERYLKHGKINPDVLNPSDIAFGYGRRVCPGREFGMAALFALMSSVLHTFNVSPPLDAEGKPLPLERKVSDGGALAILQPFECTIKPRSTEAETLILAAN